MNIAMSRIKRTVSRIGILLRLRTSPETPVSNASSAITVSLSPRRKHRFYFLLASSRGTIALSERNRSSARKFREARSGSQVEGKLRSPTHRARCNGQPSSTGRRPVEPLSLSVFAVCAVSLARNPPYTTEVYERMDCNSPKPIVFWQR
jgi:hypothetical protein